MHRNDEHHDEGFTELGAVTSATKGPPGQLNDSVGQLIPDTGLSDD